VGSASYQYNNLGLLSSVLDMNARTWTFAYSPWGSLIGVTDPLPAQRQVQGGARKAISCCQLKDSRVFVPEAG
jgi:YD repeat-containing protein